MTVRIVLICAAFVSLGSLSGAKSQGQSCESDQLDRCIAEGDDATDDVTVKDAHVSLLQASLQLASAAAQSQDVAEHIHPEKPETDAKDSEDLGGGVEPTIKNIFDEAKKADKALEDLDKMAVKVLDTALSTCASLKNQGTHFTVAVEVGTPAQKFDVVADTGSNALIVASCVCQETGSCQRDGGRCFRGTNASSSFGLTQGPLGPDAVMITFGSGTVQAVIASDVVRVGQLSTSMKDGVLLMTDNRLEMSGVFEGILGLGLPKAMHSKSRSLDGGSSSSGSEYGGSSSGSEGYGSGSGGYGSESGGYGSGSEVPSPSLPSDSTYGNDMASSQGSAQVSGTGSGGASSGKEALGDLLKKLRAKMKNRQDGGIQSQSPESLTSHRHMLEHEKMDILSQDHVQTELGEFSPIAKNLKAPKKGREVELKGFMEESGIKRFSMCFNDGADGVLRLGMPKVPTAHGSIGQSHWGVDFHGVSVGDHKVPVTFCKPGNSSDKCGAIPDSGTTVMMAPAEHLESLYESICDRWDRCKSNYTAMALAVKGATKAAVAAWGSDPWGIPNASKAKTFQNLVADCRHWITKGEGLKELPELHFHVSGSNGTKQSLKMDGWSYVIERENKEYGYEYRELPGIGKIAVGHKDGPGEIVKKCSPAFEPIEYHTKDNGAVWILGTPVFYEYNVGYDMSESPPLVSFSKGHCGACEGAAEGSVSLTQEEDTAKQQRRMYQPRVVRGPYRMPNIDLNEPL